MNTFDVVITCYNRAELTISAIDSCRGLGANLKSVIVVDDCSVDDSVSRLKAIRWDQLKVLTHKRNVGIAGARSTGYAASQADWTIGIDSDHELLPNALSEFSRLAACFPQCGVLGGRYRWDTGRITPAAVPAAPIGYRERIESLTPGHGIYHDYVCCVRRDVRSVVTWPTIRSSAGDTLFQLDLYLATMAVFTPEVVAIQKSTTIASHSRGTPWQLARRRRMDAEGFLEGNRLILERHGKSISLYNPSFLKRRAEEELLYLAMSDRPIGLKFKRITECLCTARTIKACALAAVGLFPSFLTQIILAIRLRIAQ